MKFILYLGGFYLLGLVTWVFYLGAMNLVEHRANLHPVAKANGYLVIALGLALDVAWNLAASVALLDPPQELLFTTKLKRLRAGSGWRARAAAFVCERMLNQFDAAGRHC